MKKYLISLLVVGGLFTACGKKEAEKPVEAKHKNVIVENVKMDTISDSYQSDATIVPLDKVDHSIDGTGTIKRIYKKNGDTVKKGELVVSLTDSQTEAEYNSAKANFESAKYALDSAKNNYNKYQKLYDQQMVSQLEFLDYKNRYTDALGNYEARKAAYNDAKSRYQKLNRVADTDGKVGNLYLKVGNEVKSKETLFTVVNEKEMEATVDFPGKWFNKAKIGGETTVKISDLGNKEFKGYIKEINPVANAETKKFAIKIGIPNALGEMKDGMYGKVVIPAGQRESMVVPQKSVFVRDLLSYVYVVENGAVKRVQVKTGAIEEPVIEIITENIKPGNEVVTDGIFGLEDGDLVNINKK